MDVVFKSPNSKCSIANYLFKTINNNQKKYKLFPKNSLKIFSKIVKY